MNPPLVVTLPPAVVSNTSLTPLVPAGVTAVTCVELTTFTEVAATPPIVTEVVPIKLVPLIVMVVPPDVVPVFGVIVEIVGVPAT